MREAEFELADLQRLRSLLGTATINCSMGPPVLHDFIIGEWSLDFLSVMYYRVLISRYLYSGKLDLDLYRTSFTGFIIPTLRNRRDHVRLAVNFSQGDEGNQHTDTRDCCDIVPGRMRWPETQLEHQAFTSTNSPPVKIKVYSPLLQSSVRIELTGDPALVVADIRRILNERGVYVTR